MAPTVEPTSEEVHERIAALKILFFFYGLRFTLTSITEQAFSRSITETDELTETGREGACVGMVPISNILGPLLYSIDSLMSASTLSVSSQIVKSNLLGVVKTSPSLPLLLFEAELPAKILCPLSPERLLEAEEVN